jgi:hypothetical protein
VHKGRPRRASERALDDDRLGARRLSEAAPATVVVDGSLAIVGLGVLIMLAADSVPGLVPPM